MADSAQEKKNRKREGLVGAGPGSHIKARACMQLKTTQTVYETNLLPPWIKMLRGRCVNMAAQTSRDMLGHIRLILNKQTRGR